MIKVITMETAKHSQAKNQVILVTNLGRYFVSYGKTIVFQTHTGKIFMDKKYWDYSRTTSEYRNRFLGYSTAEVKNRIKEGSIKLVDLN